jgi:hypothetical protein
LWQEILDLLSRHAKECLRFIDGSRIKLHQFGCNPAGRQKAQAIGCTKGGLNTKLCALVESQGRLMAAARVPDPDFYPLARCVDLPACPPPGTQAAIRQVKQAS